MGQPPQNKHQWPFIMTPCNTTKDIHNNDNSNTKKYRYYDWIVEQVPFWHEALSASMPPYQ